MNRDIETERNDNLSNAIRESVESELPQPDPSLRREVEQALKQQPSKPATEVRHSIFRSRILWVVVSSTAAVVAFDFFLKQANHEFTLQGVGDSSVASADRNSDQVDLVGGTEFKEAIAPSTAGPERVHDFEDLSDEVNVGQKMDSGKKSEGGYTSSASRFRSQIKSDAELQMALNSIGKQKESQQQEPDSLALDNLFTEAALSNKREVPFQIQNATGVQKPGKRSNFSTQGDGQTRAMTAERFRNGIGNDDMQEMMEAMMMEKAKQGRESDEQYELIHENQFIAPSGENALSTFSIDVDTASYSNVRRFLSSGRLPPPNAVRIEELINYFSYDYPQPKNDDPFSVNMEVAACPWSPGNRLLRIGLKGKEIHQQERPISNLVFLLDVSGSMQSEDKLPLLKRGLKMMVDQLGENDTVSIVTYASGTGVKLPPTNGTDKATIMRAIDELSAGGSTHGSAGINLAYEQAELNFLEDGTNRVILATDGDLNVGITKDDELVKLIKEKAAGNIFLTVLGFGTGNLKDGKMEKLADNGNGVYAYIDSVREARKVLVKQMSGSLITIAKDVKLQLEFNPAQVKAYRLIGYENRIMAARDFDDDRKDAGEIGAGHTVTALYEIVPTGAAAAKADDGKPSKKLKYQQQTEVKVAAPETELTEAAESDELLTLSLRFKQPDAGESKKIEFTTSDDGTPFNEASEEFRFAASVASFGMLLRNSSHRGSATISAVEEIASGALGEDAGGYRAEFIDLVRRAARLK